MLPDDSVHYGLSDTGESGLRPKLFHSHLGDVDVDVLGFSCLFEGFVQAVRHQQKKSEPNTNLLMSRFIYPTKTVLRKKTYYFMASFLSLEILKSEISYQNFLKLGKIRETK